MRVCVLVCLGCLGLPYPVLGINMHWDKDDEDCNCEAYFTLLFVIVVEFGCIELITIGSTI